MTRVNKPWVHEVILVNGRYCAKLLFISPRSQTSVHYHKTKKELLLELSHLWNGWTIIHPGQQHRFSNLGIRTQVYLELSTHHDDSDTVRLEPGGKVIVFQ